MGSAIPARIELNETYLVSNKTSIKTPTQLAAIMEKSKELYRMLDGVSQLEDWLQYKLSIAENYIDAVHGYMKYFNGGDEMDTEEIFDDETFDDVEEEDFNDSDEEFDDFDDFDDELDYDEEDGDEFEDDDGVFI